MSKTPRASRPQLRHLHAFVALALCAAPAFAPAAPTDLAQTPIASSSTSIVKPNVNFILDVSGSMAWSHAPDEARPFATRYGYKSSQCNSIYYNPTIFYARPKRSDGTDYPNASFTAAWYNGYDTTEPVVDLSTKFIAYDNITSQGIGSDAQQPAYYYRYSGTQTFNYTNVNSTFYKECNSAIGSIPGKNVFTKVTVSATSGPGGTDERQNFANWYSYYRTRLLMMKSAAGRAFASISDSYRIGFMTIYVTPTTNTADTNYLAISDFVQAQKDAWYSRLYGKDAGGNTPLKAALSRAGRNYAGVLGPDPVQYSCQQNFAILTTDGYWNNGTPNGVKIDGSSAVGNQDNSATAMPRPMYDGNLNGASNTLADVAAYYYNTDLRTANCNSGVGGADVCQDNVPVSGLDDNPKQHMTTFTVGLGVNGQLVYADNYLTGGSADFNAIKSGSKNWPVPTGDTLTTIDDLWHAAVNGRGQYFSAKNPDNLVTGLRAALAGVSSRKAAGAAAATSNLEPVAGDNFAYVANYRTQKWDGDVQARTIDVVTGAISDTPVWSGQAKIDAAVAANADSRTIFTFLGGVQKPFVPGSFSAAQKDAWFKPDAVPSLSQVSGWSPIQFAAATADSVINYLRGQYEFDERSTNVTRLYRFREHALGDIVNGKPVFVRAPPFNYTENAYQAFKSSVSGRQGTVYVAANDGMLHAFNSDTGEEMWAFVPSFVLPNLKVLADTDYPNDHRFFVDGSPTVSDIYTGSAWKTILVGGLGGGGKGYFALDVTNPASPKVLWEFTDANMGFSYGNPVVGKLADGKWSVFLTSGYNNADGEGRLYVLDADTGTLKFAVKTGVGTVGSPSGLSKISAWVDDGLNDNTIQRIYGGDLYGNVWRFDVNDSIPPAGKEATVLARLRIGSYLQPVTTKPELGLIQNKPLVFVGTGKYLGGTDTTDTSQQSLYALRDDLTATGLGDARTGSCPLVEQKLVVQDVNRRTTTNNPVDLNVNCGWYLDFDPGGATPGERVNIDPRLQLGVLAVATNIPEKSICTVGGSSFLYFFDYAKGTFVSRTGGGLPPAAGERIGSSIAVGLNVYRLPDGRVVTTVTTSDDKHPVFGNPDNPLVGVVGKRVLWRELLN